MFDNAGKQIKTYAISYVWVATLVEAISCAIVAAEITEEGIFGFLGFLIGVLVSFPNNYLIVSVK